MEVTFHNPLAPTGETRTKFEPNAAMYEANKKLEQLLKEGKPIPLSHFGRRMKRLGRIDAWRVRRVPLKSLFKETKTC